jgi:hypothetical protein
VANNTSAPFGFSQRAGTGSAPTYEIVEGLIDYNTANIFTGDPIFRLSDGTLAGITTGPGPGTQAIAGIFIGCKYLSVSQKRLIWNQYWPGSDVASGNFVTAQYINDPNAQFVAQVGGSTSVGLTQSNVGSNVQFAYGTGTVANGFSGAYIDISVTPAVTSTLPFRVVGLLTSPPGVNGTNAGQYNLAIVAFNNVETKSLTAPF